MTPAELAKVTKAARDLGFTAKELDDCKGDQVALLTLFAASRSAVSRGATKAEVVYAAKVPNTKKLKDADDDIAKRIEIAPVVKKVK